MVWQLKLGIFLLFIIVRNFSYSCNCFTDIEDFRCTLGSKTPYRCIANHNDSELHYPGCIPKKIWLIFRHGTRYPGKKFLPNMLQYLPQIRDSILLNYKRNRIRLTDEEAQSFTDWNLTYDMRNVMKLAEEGERELIDLGERYQSRFPTLLPETYNNKTYKFKYTSTQRTEESAKHFAVGLFGWKNSRQVLYPEPEQKDPILRFYKRCAKWRKEVDKNPRAYAEKEQFLKSKVFLNTLNEVSKRVGIELNYETLNLLHIACGFETAWNTGNDSPWCKLFTSKDFKVLEYINDLEHYWIDGYGYTLTYKQACAALLDAFNFFESETDSLATIYFTHSGTLLKLLALMGIAKDDQPLKHDTFKLHNHNRAWKTSIIDAFATNIALIYYDCTPGEPRILIMHQERIVNLPGCPKDIPCLISHLKDIYPDHDKECPFESMCSTNNQVEDQINDNGQTAQNT